MKIRNAELSDLKEIMTIYDNARGYMRESGNLSQWSGGYPSEELIRADIDRGNLFLCVETTDNVCSMGCTEHEELLAVFYFRIGIDPTYVRIYEGAWLDAEPYGVIHRIAVSKNSHGKGVAAFCFAYCFSLCGNLKIDTHRDNFPMQRALLKNGFRHCGIIYLENGDERLAYQKNR